MMRAGQCDDESRVGSVRMRAAQHDHESCTGTRLLVQSCYMTAHSHCHTRCPTLIVALSVQTICAEQFTAREKGVPWMLLSVTRVSHWLTHRRSGQLSSLSNRLLSLFLSLVPILYSHPAVPRSTISHPIMYHSVSYLSQCCSHTAVSRSAIYHDAVTPCEGFHTLVDRYILAAHATLQLLSLYCYACHTMAQTAHRI